MAIDQVQLRPNVLAHPSPTTGRFLLLIGCLLSAGLLAGNLFHNGLLGAEWVGAARSCVSMAEAAVPVVSSVADEIQRSDVMMACLGPYERTRALVSLGGAVLIGFLGLLVVVLVPVVLRRRFRLRPAGPRLGDTVGRIGELATQTGLRIPPRLLVGPAAQRDAFVFGLYRRYNIVLPTALAVRWRQTSLFDPVVRHELAHIRRHDVPLAWLATSVWLAAIPVLALPAVMAVVWGDVSLMSAYLWRVAVVLAILWLVQRQALRSREHDADLHAARQAGDWRPLSAVLETGASAPGWWQRLVSHHPTMATRLRVLADPGRVRGVSIVDGLAAGFLTAVLLPLIHGLLLVATTGTSIVGWSPYISAALVGPITGLAVGVGLWRQALIDQVTGVRTWPGGVVAAVVVGLLLGQTLRLDDLGLDAVVPSAAPIAALMGAAAVLLSAATGQLWADASARLPGGPKSWWIGFLVNALIFAVSLWALQWVPVLIEASIAGGLTLSDLILTMGRLVGTAFYMAVVPLVVATAAMVWRRRDLPTPGWLVEGPPVTWSRNQARDPSLSSAVLAGAVPGLFAAAIILIHRLVMGSPTDDAERVDRYLLWLTTGALVAVAVSFATMVCVPRSGGAVGLVTGSIAAFVAALGMVAANTFIIGNTLELSFWWSTIVAVATLWLAGHLLLMPITLVVWPAPWRNVPGWLLTLGTALAGGMIALVILGVALADA